MSTVSQCCLVRLFSPPQVPPAVSTCSWCPESRRSSSVSLDWLRHQLAPVWRCRAAEREETPPQWGWSANTGTDYKPTLSKTYLSAPVHHTITLIKKKKGIPETDLAQITLESSETSGEPASDHRSHPSAVPLTSCDFLRILFWLSSHEIKHLHSY